jgi:hypothetical protein
VQYCVPNDLCTLWHRFGCAGHAAGTEATGILLVEKNHFDSDRQKGIAASEARKAQQAKRKVSEQGGRSPKRPASSAIANVDDHVNPAHVSDDEEVDAHGYEIVSDLVVHEDEAFGERSEEARRASYNKRLFTMTTYGSKPALQSLKIGSALDDLINAPTRGIKCRRTVFNMYFGNDKACKYFFACTD